jgi:CubicO group peptidase (beta-lactamase class C family)
MATRVPPDAWQVGPWNRSSYVHVDEVVPTVPVPRGDGAVRELPRRDADLGDVAAEVLTAGCADGLAVLHDGVLELERYGGEMDETLLHLSQSVGKSVLGLLTGILAGDGRVDPRAPVTELVPEVAGSGWEGATLQHLLDMTAAIDFVEDYDAFVRYDAACAWHPALPEFGPETVLEYLPTVGPAPDWRHGERFHYATPNTDLLGIAVERAGGAPLATLIARELWGPLGAERDAALTVDHAGTATIGGGFCATLRDYARLGLLVCEGGGGIVPAGWIAGLGTGDPRAFAQATAIELRSGADGYHDQWWHRDGGVMARGIHGQLIAVHRDERVVVVVLSSWPEATDAEREDAQRTLVARVRDRLTA